MYAALSSSLMTGQSTAAASFGAVAVDHIQQGIGAVTASDGQLTFFCKCCAGAAAAAPEADRRARHGRTGTGHR